MVWHVLKYWVSFFIAAFYKRTQIKNLSFLKVKGPAIIAMNHPNAFSDPIVFTYRSYPLRSYYMARGDAFKPGFIAWTLEQIGIVPIFRIQDGGKEGLKKNDEAYRRVNHLLRRKNKIIVFAEGICVQERRLRPLKKGVARMVFGAYEALNNDQLVVYPIGVNYYKPDKFRSQVFYNVGEPIPIKDFMPVYEQNPARANNVFLQVLETKMKALVTHINDKNYDEVVYCVEDLIKKDLIKEKGLNYKNLSDDFDVLTGITEKVNKAVIENTALVDEFKIKAPAYFLELRKHGLRDWLINPKQNHNVNYPVLFFRYLVLFIGFPFHLIGLVGNYTPFKLTDKLARKIAKTKEFRSSISIGLGMVLFSINYLLWFFILRLFFSSCIWPLGICVILMSCAWLSLYYYPFLKKTLGMQRALKNKELVQDFLQRRINLINLINKF